MQEGNDHNSMLWLHRYFGFDSPLKCKEVWLGWQSTWANVPNQGYNRFSGLLQLWVGGGTCRLKDIGERVWDEKWKWKKRNCMRVWYTCDHDMPTVLLMFACLQEGIVTQPGRRSPQQIEDVPCQQWGVSSDTCEPVGQWQGQIRSLDMIRCPRNLVPGRQQGNHVAKSSVLQPHPMYASHASTK